MAVIPLCFAAWHLIAIFGQQRGFIGSIAIRTFPSGYFHKVATERHFSLVKRTGAKLTRCRVRLTRMHCGSVDLLRDLIGAVTDKLIGKLDRIVPRRINTMRIHISPSVGHPVGQQFARTGAVFYPHRLAEPEPFYLWRLTNHRAAVGSDRQQAIEGTSLLPRELCQYGRQFYRALIGFEDLIKREIIHRRRHARVFRLGDRRRLDHARLKGLVITPLQQAAFRCCRVARVADVG